MTFRIVTVCTGNICRSPIAELILAAELATVPDVHVESAGIGALIGHGVPAPGKALALTYGIDASAHIARQVDIDMLAEADLILGMDRGHRRRIVETLPTSMRRAFTLREFARIAHAVSNDLPAAVRESGALSTKDAMRTAVALGSTMRGRVEPPATQEELDIIDPYRRSDETYRLSFEQLAPAAGGTAQYLRAAARLAATT